MSLNTKNTKEKKVSSGNGFDYLTLIRIVAAVALLVLAKSLTLDNLIYKLFLLATILVAGFDIVFSAVNLIADKKYFEYDIFVLLAAVVAFSAGCAEEAALLVVIYKLCKFLLDYLVGHVKATATDYIDDNRQREIAFLKEIISRPEAGKTSLEDKLAPIMDLFSKAAVVVGILYAIAMPLIVNITYVASVRRGMMLIIASAPLSVLAALPISSIIGICHSAACGVFMRDGEMLEMAAKLNTVIIDKAGVVTTGAPDLISFTSPIFNNDTFLNIAAHVAYNSSQRIAAPILRAFKGELRPEIIDTFKELPGNGMEITIKGLPISLSTKEVLETRGIEIPTGSEMDGTVLYMTVAGRYAGGLQFNEKISPYAEAAVSDLETVSGARIALLTDDNNAKSMALAERLSIKDYICECDTYKKYDAVQHTSSKMRKNDVLMFVTSEELEYHTDADIDAKVGSTTESADMLITGYGKGSLPLSSLPYACTTAKRTRSIQLENIIFALFIKLVLIVLAFAGIATLWFVVLADIVAAMLTVINTSRISDVSIITKLFKV